MQEGGKWREKGALGVKIDVIRVAWLCVRQLTEKKVSTVLISLSIQHSKSHPQRGGTAAARQHQQLDNEAGQAYPGFWRRQFSGLPIRNIRAAALQGKMDLTQKIYNVYKLQCLFLT